MTLNIHAGIETKLIIFQNVSKLLKVFVKDIYPEKIWIKDKNSSILVIIYCYSLSFTEVVNSIHYSLYHNTRFQA